jgi:hypothetical protein
MKKLTQLIFSFGLFIAVLYAPVAIAADPDPNANPVLADFIKGGVKAYYMGNQLGYNGWFLEKDNQIQLAYTTPDNHGLVIGVLFDNKSNNISSQQIKDLYDSNKEVNAFMMSLNAQQQKSYLPTQTPQMQPAYNSAAGYNPSAGAAAPVAAASPILPVSPGERLIKALDNANGLNLGAQSAPKLYMVADPNCPHCQATWKMLRSAIFSGKLQVRLVPIDAIDADSARASAQFLSNANPLDAWDKYVMGDHSQLAGTPTDIALAAVRLNHQLIDSWNIHSTPYMVYKAKDGQIKIIQGEPQQGADMIDDIAP